MVARLHRGRPSACYRPRMGISWQELIVVLLIVLVLFGPKRLPEIGSSLGRGIRGFKDSMEGRDGHTSQRSELHPEAPAEVTQAGPRAVPVPVEVVETPVDERR
ncbi:MAG: tatA [Thermoleophilia bacterium]|nr:tatA [Thermoleophilia bacterium]